jgi:hypothetical protein
VWAATVQSLIAEAYVIERPIVLSETHDGSGVRLGPTEMVSFGLTDKGVFELS